MEIEKTDSFTLTLEDEENSTVFCVVRNKKTHQVEGRFCGTVEDMCKSLTYAAWKLRNSMCDNVGMPKEVAKAFVMGAVQMGVMLEDMEAVFNENGQDR